MKKNFIKFLMILIVLNGVSINVSASVGEFQYNSLEVIEEYVAYMPFSSVSEVIGGDLSRYMYILLRVNKLKRTNDNEVLNNADDAEELQVNKKDYGIDVLSYSIEACDEEHSDSKIKVLVKNTGMKPWYKYTYEESKPIVWAMFTINKKGHYDGGMAVREVDRVTTGETYEFYFSFLSSNYDIKDIDVEFILDIKGEEHFILIKRVELE